MDDLISSALEQLLGDRCTPQVVRAIEAGESPAELWRQLEQSGFPDALVPEDLGGAGLALPEAFSLLSLCGRYALPVPLAETVLARALLGQAGFRRPSGSIALAPVNMQDGHGLRCAAVSFGWVADHVLTVFNGHALLLPTARAERTNDVFALDASLRWDEEEVANSPRIPDRPDLETLQACAVSAQLAGALDNVFKRTLDYANERQQFGRPIGKFQAIQHQLSVMAQHAAAARMAAQLGCESAGITPERLRVAIAKARTSEASVEVAAAAHAIHGAIGLTAELDLQLYTRRLHVWRRVAGSESYWHGVLGEELVDRCDGHAVDLVRIVTDRAEPVGETT